MKVIPTEGTTIVSEDLKPMEMGISQNREDQLMILNVLSNTLYTDKISAVLREYGCNGQDANVEAGKPDLPIHVRLPNKLEPSVVIRDFGYGMTMEQVENTFAKLGRSTKRHSNDFTGMLGIGSKAGFAYGDSFLVTSYVKGTKTVYNCYRDKGVPTLVKMQEESTKEDDGIEITVPVRVSDVDEFARRAARVYRYFRVPPKISGADVQLTRGKAEFSGDMWRFVGDQRSVAVMGNVGYDLTAAGMGVMQPKYSSLIQLGVELDFKIGELEINASREGLQYRDATKAKVIERLDKMAAEIGKVFTDRISKAATLWEAKCLYNQTFEKLGSQHMRSLRDVLTDTVTWKGVALKSSQFELQVSGLPVSTFLIEKGYGTRLYRSQNRHYIHASPNVHLVLNDLQTGKNSPARERGFFQSTPDATHMLLFSFGDEVVKKKYLKQTGLEGAPFINLSSIKPVYSANHSSGGGTSAHRSKHAAKVFVLNEVEPPAHPGARTARSQWWNVVDVDLKKDAGLYVELREFFAYTKPTAGSGPGSSDPEILRRIVVALRQFKVLDKELIYGVKTSALDKMPKDWTRLEEFLRAKMDKLLQDKKFLQDIADYTAAREHPHVFDYKHAALFPEGTPIRTLLDTQHRMLNPSSSPAFFEYIRQGTGMPWMRRPASVKLPAPSASLKKLETDMLDRYPMVRLWLARVSYMRLENVATQDMNIFADYVKLIERKTK